MTRVIRAFPSLLQSMRCWVGICIVLWSSSEKFGKKDGRMSPKSRLTIQMPKAQLWRVQVHRRNPQTQKGIAVYSCHQALWKGKRKHLEPIAQELTRN